MLRMRVVGLEVVHVTKTKITCLRLRYAKTEPNSRILSSYADSNNKYRQNLCHSVANTTYTEPLSRGSHKIHSLV